MKNIIDEIINRGKALVTFKDIKEIFNINMQPGNEFSSCFLEAEENGKDHYSLTIGYDNGENWKELKKVKVKDMFFRRLQREKESLISFRGVMWCKS